MGSASPGRRGQYTTWRYTTLFKEGSRRNKTSYQELTEIASRPPASMNLITTSPLQSQKTVTHLKRMSQSYALSDFATALNIPHPPCLQHTHFFKLSTITGRRASFFVAAF